MQIGSAFASTLGQLVRMSEERLRTIGLWGGRRDHGHVQRSAHGGVLRIRNRLAGLLHRSALRNDPLGGRRRPRQPGRFRLRAILSNLPHNLVVNHDGVYLLMVVLGVASGILGWGVKTFLYRLEDIADALWKERPEWARPAVGGVGLGALLLLIPQMYGVGYPVMAKACGALFCGF